MRTTAISNLNRTKDFLLVGIVREQRGAKEGGNLIWSTQGFFNGPAGWLSGQAHKSTVRLPYDPRKKGVFGERVGLIHRRVRIGALRRGKKNFRVTTKR